MRIGIHTGPAVAGVLGKRKLFYDVWGDTVNTAARMEAYGSPDRIQVTEAVYRQLRRTTLRAAGDNRHKGQGADAGLLSAGALAPPQRNAGELFPIVTSTGKLRSSRRLHHRLCRLRADPSAQLTALQEVPDHDELIGPDRSRLCFRCCSPI